MNVYMTDVSQISPNSVGWMELIFLPGKRVVTLSVSMAQQVGFKQKGLLCINTYLSITPQLQCKIINTYKIFSAASIHMIDV